MYFSSLTGVQHLHTSLIAQVNSDRISHAQLIYGPEGSGGLALALAYASFILCENKSETDSCGQCKACSKSFKMVHPDLHYIFPTISTKDVTGKEVVSDSFLSHFRSAVLSNPYLSNYDWLNTLDGGGKQSLINVRDAEDIIDKIYLQSYEAEYKILIIWLAEKMNQQTANKLLIVIEEPPDKTLFILVSETPDQLLPTILSRTQKIKIPKISDTELATFLINRGVNPELAKESALVADGNLLTALQLSAEAYPQQYQLDLFKQWMRCCYKPFQPATSKWCDLFSGLGREGMKNFFVYGIHLLRQALIYNMAGEEMLRVTKAEKEFLLKFHPFIHPKNCSLMVEEITKANKQILQNGSAKILMMDLTFRLSQFINIPMAQTA